MIINCLLLYANRKRPPQSAYALFDCVQNYFFVCEPSQYGGVFVRAQLQTATFFFSLTENSIGSFEVPAWEPSQNPGFFDLPQLHQ